MAKVSRRCGSRGTAAVAEPYAGVARPGAGKVEPKSWFPRKWDKETDVLVIGFGGAGAAAAIEAADSGAEVIILEKMRKPGGAIYMSAGVIYAAGTLVQRAAGITDTAEAMYQYWIATDRLKDPAMVRVIADGSSEVIDWLTQMGAVFPPEDLYCSGAEAEFCPNAGPTPRGHCIRIEEGTVSTRFPGRFMPYRGGPHLFGVLERAVRSRRIEVMLETAAKELITNANREVIGVQASGGQKLLHIHARRGVVIADGGFTRNLDMHKKYSAKAPYIVAGRLIMKGHPGATGDGIRMAMAIGADLCDMHTFHAHPIPYLPHGVVCVTNPGPRYPSIYVNGSGLRFVNEDRHSAILSDELDKQDSIAFEIFDDEVCRKARVPISESKVLVSAPTIRGLAEKLRISPENLEYTINTWNEDAKSGKDLQFGKTGATVGPIKVPPFWGGQLRRYANITYGGLKTNANAQVLDVLHGKPIPRLYAAGQTVGGYLGSFYPGSGSAIANCLVFGRIAGKQAAAESL